MKVIFMGTPEFAVPCLEILLEEGYNVAAAVTQPDKPKGRGNKLAAPPVKEYALSKGIPVLQPAKIKAPEAVSQLKELHPRLIVTAAYGQLLSQEILDIPEYGCINVHASLLPKYRGAAPIQWAIVKGEKTTGITTMFTDIGMDTGDMLLKEELEIGPDMTFRELHDRMSLLGPKVLKETLEKLKEGKLRRIPQQAADATNAPPIKKEMGKISWGEKGRDIHNLVRGIDPFPGAFTFYKGQRMRVWKTCRTSGDGAGQRPDRPGRILNVSREGILVATGEGTLRITEVQLDSGRRMFVEEYLRGHQIDEGEIFG